MHTWIALFRGINVGGNHSLPMKKLSAMLEELDCVRVQTYIQSGNVVFATTVKKGPALGKRIGDQVEAEFGFRPALLLLTLGELQTAIVNNPFPQAISDPKTLHFFFLAVEPDSPDLATLQKQATATERFQLLGRVFYLHTPDGFGKSKLAGIVEKKLGVTATARNYRAVEMLAAMAAADTGG
ncbi:hypothetical protein ETAA8_64780 [Anatilimnocola aggregata]|uniref:DUF1697 domain-containing protein n=1 Tax=Anatilimnocola aggregata TaxID=2528021 RepID=A0A517YM80_9BACT|nr:DUF1697 domain-containing protein [Anatilimnocola aggregata]QDU31325.1 hypothetical protein ETAA8_64780 [Anatilimnocola aggregata]